MQTSLIGPLSKASGSVPLADTRTERSRICSEKKAFIRTSAFVNRPLAFGTKIPSHIRKQLSVKIHPTTLAVFGIATLQPVAKLLDVVVSSVVQLFEQNTQGGRAQTPQLRSPKAHLEPHSHHEFFSQRFTMIQQCKTRVSRNVLDVMLFGIPFRHGLPGPSINAQRQAWRKFHVMQEVIISGEC